MKLLKVKLKDYGLYRGEVEFDLAPRSNGSGEKPIILFGGKNGAGKTTLLQAVKLGLYGKASQGRVSQQEYFSFLKSKIHRSRCDLLNPQAASIEILFDLVVGGEKSRYQITRSWVGNNGGDPHETLRLEKNGELVKDIEPKFQQEFISGIVPENLSQLFFFDGEKIKSIAEDITSNAAIADSIKTLLGLDVVEKLQADLSIYSQREIKNSASKEDLAAVEKQEQAIAKLKEDLDQLQEQKAEVRTQIDGTNNEIEKCEKRLAEEGASFAGTLTEEKSHELEIDAQRGVIEKQIRQECESAFPLSLCPKTSKWLQAVLKKEANQSGSDRVCSEIENIRNRLQIELHNNKKLKKEPAKDLLFSIVEKTLDGRLKELQSELGFEPLLGLPGAEQQRIEGWFNEATKGRENVKALCTELEEASRDLSESRRKQNRAPDEDVLKPIFIELSELNEQKGSQKERLNFLEAETNKIRCEIDATERTLGKLLDANKKVEGSRRQLELAKKAQEALTEYAERLAQIKIEGLRQSIAESFNFLIRKDALVHDVTINPKTFEVTLFDKNNNPFEKDELSSGEKQLFAISFLWALAKSSGRPLPVIIDTPLGRLDSDHRLNLVRHYFPNAAHQVIILSTDTEVDKGLFKELKPSISHCYHLKYNKKETRTSPVEGYFWNNKSDG
jgi:DNA sulfur modification protein DndD